MALFPRPRQKTPRRWPRRPIRPASQHSIVAMHFLASFMTLLRFKAHGCDRTGIQPLEADRLTRYFAIPVFSFFDAAQGRVDLGHQFALSITRAQFQRTVRFLAGAVSHIRERAGAI